MCVCVFGCVAVCVCVCVCVLAGYFTQGGELAPRPSGFPRLAFFPGATRGALAYPPSSCESQEVPPASKSQPGDPPEPLVGNLGGLEWWWWWSWWVVVLVVLRVWWWCGILPEDWQSTGPPFKYLVKWFLPMDCQSTGHHNTW